MLTQARAEQRARAEEADEEERKLKQERRERAEEVRCALISWLVGKESLLTAAAAWLVALPFRSWTSSKSAARATCTRRRCTTSE